jgi:hypothetical protein
MKSKLILPSAIAMLLCIYHVQGQATADSIVREILAKRPAPLLDFKTQETITVAMKPNANANALPAVKEAIAAAKARGVPIKIIFEKGRYRFDVNAGDHTFCVTLDGMNDLIVDGQGSEITITNPYCGFFRLNDCKNIIVKGFTVDYDPLPFTQGVVEVVHPESNSIDVRSQEGFLPFHTPILQFNGGHLMDREHPGRNKPFVEQCFFPASHQKLGDDFTRITFVSDRSPGARYTVRDNFAVGDHYVETSRHEGSSICGFDASDENVTFMDVTAYASPVSSYVGGVSCLNLIRCKTLIKPGRWISANADSVHLQSSRIGPWIENCVFEGPMDDQMNFYTIPLPIEAMPKDDTYKFSGPASKKISKGDSLTLFDCKSGLVVGQATVLAVDREKETVTLDHSFKELNSGNRDDYRFYNHNLVSRFFVLKNNVFRNSSGNGLFSKGSFGFIEGNTFEGLAASALLLYNINGAPNVFANEGLGTDDLVVRGNTFRECGYNANFFRIPFAATISISAGDSPNRTKGGILHRNLFFENNKFDAWRKCAFYIGNAENVHVRNNTFTNAKTSSSSKTPTPFIVSCSKDVFITKNKLVDSMAFEKLLQTGDDVTGLRVSGNTLNNRPRK